MKAGGRAKESGTYEAEKRQQQDRKWVKEPDWELGRGADPPDCVDDSSCPRALAAPATLEKPQRAFRRKLSEAEGPPRSLPG